MIFFVVIVLLPIAGFLLSATHYLIPAYLGLLVSGFWTSDYFSTYDIDRFGRVGKLSDGLFYVPQTVLFGRALFYIVIIYLLLELVAMGYSKQIIKFLYISLLFSMVMIFVLGLVMKIGGTI